MKEEWRKDFVNSNVYVSPFSILYNIVNSIWCVPFINVYCDDILQNIHMLFTITTYTIGAIDWDQYYWNIFSEIYVWYFVCYPS